MNKNLNIGVACDHAGFKLKKEVMKFLKNKQYNAVDFGTDNEEDAVDYPDYAKILCTNLLDENINFGILICGSGIGMAIAANRLTNIRAAICNNVEYAQLARAHNNANILVLGARFIETKNIGKIIDAFLNTDFEGGRHLQRVKKLN